MTFGNFKVYFWSLYFCFWTLIMVFRIIIPTIQYPTVPYSTLQYHKAYVGLQYHYLHQDTKNLLKPLLFILMDLKHHETSFIVLPSFQGLQKGIIYMGFISALLPWPWAIGYGCPLFLLLICVHSHVVKIKAVRVQKRE